MNLDAVSKAIRARFLAEVATPKSLGEFQVDNLEFTQPEDATWARVTVIPSATEQADIVPGRRYRAVGIAMFSFFSPFNKGDEELNLLADYACTKFRTVSASGVTYRTPSPARVGRAGKWWQVNVTVPWYSDIVAAP